jgi:large subunit ribosomal protein L20
MRVKTAVPRHRRIKRLKKATKGFHGGRRRLLRTMKDAHQRAMAQAFRGRKEKKRQYRGMWIIRINAACRQRGIPYGRFMDGLKKKGIALDRKALAHLAAMDPAGFDAVVNAVRGG